jgi:hypothetical protein
LYNANIKRWQGKSAAAQKKLRGAQIHIKSIYLPGKMKIINKKEGTPLYGIENQVKETADWRYDMYKLPK